MAWLFWLLALLVPCFSGSLSLYLVRYRWRVTGRWRVAACLLVTGTVLTLAVGVLVFFLVWPPPFWCYLL